MPLLVRVARGWGMSEGKARCLVGDRRPAKVAGDACSWTPELVDVALVLLLTTLLWVMSG
jgi:hypothetical protein